MFLQIPKEKPNLERSSLVLSVIRSIKIFLLLLPLLAGVGNAQVTIDDLTAEVSIYGDVVLRWSIPQGTIISKYTIYRGTDFDSMKIIAEIPYPVVKQYTDFYTNLVPGTVYLYALKAVDFGGQIGRKNIEVLVTPPPTTLRFLSTPPISAFVGGDYYYTPVKTDALNPEDVEFSFSGAHPAGMDMNTVGSGASRMTFVYWRPSSPGQYKVAIIARHKVTRAVAIQEFTINVAFANQIGMVRGSVLTVEGKPLRKAMVRVFQVKYGLQYETYTDTAGAFEIKTVQIGEIYAWARAASDRYLPQWYPLGKNISDVSPRPLATGDTLVYTIYLQTSPNNPTRISGKVKSQLTGLPVDSTRISFVRKANFINIGDTTISRDPSSRSNFAIDTTVMTNSSGQFEASLLVGYEYYTITEHPRYLSSFNIDRLNVSATNALDARTIRIVDNMTDVNFTLVANNVPTPNRIVGTVRNAVSGLDKQAVIVLFNPDLQRGAGGGHTYSRVSSINDKNGYYSFDNLTSGTYSILAIPLDKDLAPKFYTSGGGTTIATSSEVVVPNGTVQDLDFSLNAIAPGGVGTIFGQVTVQDKNGISPAPGTLVLAMTSDTKDVVGYAISDSVGMYSITGIPKGKFILMGQNIEYGSVQSPVTELDYSTFNLYTQVKAVHLNIDTRVTGIDPAAVPEDVTLYQNYPNPFNPTTQIQFGVPTSGHVTVRVYNSIGSEIAVLLNEKVSAGTHTIDFDGRRFGSGTYYYQLQSGNRIITRSMLLVK